MLINMLQCAGHSPQKGIVWPQTSSKSSSYQQNFKCKKTKQKNINYFHRDNLLKQKQHAGRPLRCIAWMQKLAMCGCRSWKLVLTVSHIFWILLLQPIMMINPVLDPILEFFRILYAPESSLNLIELRLFSLLVFKVSQQKT